jgi:hypothetical protein
LTITLNVDGSSLNYSGETQLEEGSRVILKCTSELKTTEKLEYKWRFRAVTVISNSTVILPSLVMNDSGNYTCVGETSGGERQTAQIFITVVPKDTGGPSTSAQVGNNNTTVIVVVVVILALLVAGAAAGLVWYFTKKRRGQGCDNKVMIVRNEAAAIE